MDRCLILFICLPLVLGSPNRQVRNVIQERTKIWQRGIVAYVISGAFLESQVKTIEAAMHEIETASSFHQNSCIRFVKREGQYGSEQDFVYIRTGDTCTSDVGKQGGRQNIVLRDTCVTVPQVMYHLVRIIGLYNEHNRPDRDKFIDVHMDNIAASDRSKFTKLNLGESDLLNLAYDFNSITHFGPYDFAVDPSKPTISSKVKSVDFGHKAVLSIKDVMKIQYLHNCGLDTSHIPHLPAHPINCDFEHGICGVANDWTDDMEWVRKSGSVSATGPLSDHSNGNGYYLYVGGNKTGQARLLGARELQSGIYCLELSYYLVGNSGTAAISIYAEDFPTPQNRTILIANSAANPSNSWNQIKQLFDHVNPWRLTIEASVTSPASGVAVDDLEVYSGACP